MMKLRLLLIALLLFGCAIHVQAYDNDGRDAQGNGLLKGGPHRTINELAFSYWHRNAPDVRIRNYILIDDLKLMGPTVVEPGLESVTTEDRAGSVRWWVTEGGYDADEPELYNSFRHFYDPISLDGVPYLTDQLDKLDYVYRAWVWGTQTGRIVGTLIGAKFNPEVNARDWAISGEQKKGWGRNEYNWDRGVEYMQAAFAEGDGQKKQRLFAQAWRSLGETMHLLGDMTCVPHVRNDSHPGKAIGYGPIGNTDPNLGMLKNDPYELFTTDQVARDSSSSPLDPTAKRLIDTAPDILTLFRQTALYTQERFFSADTIGGSYLTNKGKPNERRISVTPANGKKTYPKPVLADCIFDEQTGYFSTMIHGNPVRLCHETWLSSIGWGDPAKDGPQISEACVLDQAKVLIPVAIYANAKLADWFVPRMEVGITDIDALEQTLSGTLKHIPYGAHKTALQYTPDAGQRFYLWLNGKAMPSASYQLSLANGVISGKLPGLSLKNDDTVSIGVVIGGLVIRSADFQVSIGEIPANCWVFDRVVMTKDIPKDNSLPGNSRTIDVNLWETGAKVSHEEISTAINGYTFTYESLHDWTKPPKILIPGEKMTVHIGVKLGEWSLTGNQNLRTNWSASTWIYGAQTPIKAGAGDLSRVGEWGVGSRKDLRRPDSTVMQEESDAIFTIPICYRPGYEMAFWFTCGNGNVMYYYRWTGTFQDADPGEHFEGG